jgi:hypothetical protein
LIDKPGRVFVEAVLVMINSFVADGVSEDVEGCRDVPFAELLAVIAVSTTLVLVNVPDHAENSHVGLLPDVLKVCPEPTVNVPVPLLA